MSGLRRWAYGCALLLVAVVLSVAPGSWLRWEATVVPALRWVQKEGTVHELETGRGGVAYIAMDEFVADRPLTLLGYDLPIRDPALDLAAVRVLFLRRSFRQVVEGHLPAYSWPTGDCTDRWPPRGFGQTYPVAGQRVRRGDHVRFVVFLAPHDPRQLGHYGADGHLVRFHADGYDQTLTIRHAAGLDVDFVDDTGYRWPACRGDDWWLDPKPGFPS